MEIMTDILGEFHEFYPAQRKLERYLKKQWKAYKFDSLVKENITYNDERVKKFAIGMYSHKKKKVKHMIDVFLSELSAWIGNSPIVMRIPPELIFTKDEVSIRCRLGKMDELDKIVSSELKKETSSNKDKMINELLSDMEVKEKLEHI